MIRNSRYTFKVKSTRLVEGWVMKVEEAEGVREDFYSWIRNNTIHQVGIKREVNVSED